MLPSIVSKPQLDAMCQLLLRAPPGDVVEVGVYEGGSAYRLYEVCLMQGRKLHLFDTFMGTPHWIEGLDKHKPDDEFCPPDGTLERLEALMPLAKIYPGTFPHTLAEAELGPLAFVHVDCDQYQSVKDCIDHLWPKVVGDGMMLFDDYPYLDGAKKAVEDAFNPRRLQLCHNRSYAVKSPG